MLKYALPAAFLLPALAGWIPLRAQGKSFEAASIKEALPLSMENIRASQFRAGVEIDGSRARYTFLSLADLITYAYRVKPYQASGPAWMNDTRWDITAKIGAGQPADRAPEMMQTLLAERFRLAIHRENRKQSLYELLVGSSGLKIKEAAVEGNTPAAPGDVHTDSSFVSGGPIGTVRVMRGPNGSVRLQMAKTSLSALAGMLMQFTDRPVVNATGLEGDYEVTLDLPSDLMNSMPGAQKFTAILGLGSFGMTPDASGAAISQVVKDLGLALKPRTAPVETIIVDHLEKTPTAN